MLLHDYNTSLLLGAVLSFIAALIHFVCIPWGTNGYRFLGAGGKIVGMSEAGHWYPPFITLVIGGVLSVCALYALSGAGVFFPFPYLRWVLVVITAAYLLRAVAFPLLRPTFPGNSTLFWLVSSSICLVIGSVHCVGVIQMWDYL